MPSPVEIAVDSYIRAATERDRDARAKLLEACFAEDGRFVTRSGVLQGRAAVDAMLARGLADPELAAIRLVSTIDAKGTTFRYRAVVERRDGTTLEFFDAGEIDSDGKITTMLVFAGPLADAPAVSLRRARPDDADFFYRARTAGFREYVEQVFGPWEDSFQRPHADSEFAELPVEIIECDGEPIGYQAVVRHDDHWFLDEIVLLPAARNRGIGTRLVRDVMAAARAAQLPLRLSVLHVNPAQTLYARLGFRVERIEHPRVKMVWP